MARVPICSVPGKVVSSKVAQSRSNKQKTRFRAGVVYKYTVDGREFQSDTISFGMESTSSKAAYRIRNRYPKGKEVMVSYNPESPETAVLEPGATWTSYGVLGVGLAFFGVGLLLFGSSLLRWLGLGFALTGIFGALFLRHRKVSANLSWEPSDPPPPASSRSGRTPGAPHNVPDDDQTSTDDGIDIR